MSTPMKIWEYGQSSAIETATHYTGTCLVHGWVISGGGANGVLAGAVSILDNATVLAIYPAGTPSAALSIMGVDINIATSLKTTLAHADDLITILYRPIGTS